MSTDRDWHALPITLDEIVRDRTPTSLAEGFRHFARSEFPGYSPLYEALSWRIAEDDGLLTLAGHARAGQYPQNLLFAAVHHLLLGGIQDPLARFYATLTGAPSPPDEAFPYFRYFCTRNEAVIRGLVESRIVQTNEVGRSACLLPAFAHVARLNDDAPLALIDVGAAAGLNLLFDRYHFDYGSTTWGDPASTVRLTCELREGTELPIAPGRPVVGYRAGVDLNPIDVTDDEAVRWLRALVWPDIPRRERQLVAAAAIARQDPPHLYAGDAAMLVPELIAAIPRDLTLCIYHSFALHQFPPASRAAFDAALTAASRERPVYLVGMSGSTQEARVTLSSWHAGQVTAVQLAECPAHGQWLRWLA